VPPERLRLLGVGPGRSINFLRWAWRLAERGHEVHIVSDQITQRPAELQGIAAHDLCRLEPLTRVRGLRRFRLVPALSSLARRLDVDLVHAHYLLPYGWWAARARVHPLVVSPWGTDILVDAAKPPGKPRAERALAAADFLVVNSRVNEQASIALGADPGRIERIVWYAEPERFAPERRDTGLRSRLGWPDDAFVVLSLRNFRPDTNVDVIVRAFAAVAREEPRARLLLAARSGPLERSIETLIDELGLAALVTIRFVPADELPAVVASADVVVQMTISDSTPASLLEAMASGLPAVCGAAPSLDEWVEQGNGAEIVPPLDTNALAAALLRMLRDAELRRAYGERNRRVVNERVVDPGPALEALYLRLLGR
jgi:glycosyltransferase involved in cell wall biosynthesis